MIDSIIVLTSLRSKRYDQIDVSTMIGLVAEVCYGNGSIFFHCLCINKMIVYSCCAACPPCLADERLSRETSQDKSIYCRNYLYIKVIRSFTKDGVQLKNLLFFIVICLGTWQFFAKDHTIVEASQKKTVSVKAKKTTKPKTIYKCDGRQYCSQMRSYEEAKYFIQHCPNTKMDGDHDGIPCERQFNK